MAGVFADRRDAQGILCGSIVPGLRMRPVTGRNSACTSGAIRQVRLAARTVERGVVDLSANPWPSRRRRSGRTGTDAAGRSRR